MNRRRVVITGLGVATPLGWELDAFWTALLEKRSGIGRISAFDPARFKSQIGGELPKFSLGDFVPKSYRKSAKVMSRDIMISMVAAHRACQDAGLRTPCMIDRGEAESPTNLDPARFGANIGAGLICADVVELANALASATDDAGTFDIRQWGTEGMSNLTPLWLLKFLPNMLACHVTIVHDAQAPSNTLTCGEASSHLAVGEAYRTICRDAADVCICGGVESKLNPMSLMRQDIMGRLSRENDAPELACRPFAADAAGTVAAEGGGLLILEELEHARARGARIYAEIVGFGASCNTRSWRTPDGDGRGLAQAMVKALDGAGLAPASVGLLTTFGTGIPQFDASEAAAIHAVFGADAVRVPALAIKGAVGNSGAGSGSLDLAAGILAMQYNTVPPAATTAALAGDLEFNLVREQPVDARVDSVLSVAYALSGGQTAALVLRRVTEPNGVE